MQSAFIGAETRKKEAQAFAESAIPQAQAEADAAVQTATLRRGFGTRARHGRRRRLSWRWIANIGRIRQSFASVCTGTRWNARYRSAGKVRWVPPPIGGSYHGFRITTRHRQCEVGRGSASPDGKMTTDESTTARSQITLPGNPAHIGRSRARGAPPHQHTARRGARWESGFSAWGRCWCISSRINGRSASFAGGWRRPSWESRRWSRALRGIVTGDTRRATDQLVAIAVLAAAATGDFVTATLIPLFLEIGRLFEERSSLGARAAIDGIRALGARQAVRWRNGVEERVDPNSLAAGR